MDFENATDAGQYRSGTHRLTLKRVPLFDQYTVTVDGFGTFSLSGPALAALKSSCGKGESWVDKLCEHVTRHDGVPSGTLLLELPKLRYLEGGEDE